MAVTFYDCLMACSENDDLVQEYNRLNGTAIGRDLRSPLDKLIGSTSGYEQIVQMRMDEELVGFVHFAYDIWQRMPLEARQ